MSRPDQPLARVWLCRRHRQSMPRGFACERMDHPVTLEDGVNYRITTFEEAGGDPFFDLADLPEHSACCGSSARAYIPWAMRIRRPATAGRGKDTGCRRFL